MLETEQVQMGDYASNLGYRFYPNALCLEVSCSRTPTGVQQTYGSGPICFKGRTTATHALAGVRLYIGDFRLGLIVWGGYATRSLNVSPSARCLTA